ncbi:MAG: hypothetical protein ABIS51_16060 [Sphingomonas sp.]
MIHVSPESPWWIAAAAMLILVVHIAGGAIGLLSGTAALIARKGSDRHRLAGTIFVVSMLVMAAIVAFAAALNLKVILRGGITGTPRIARHIWRMCTALFNAAASFFLGQQKIMPVSIRGSFFLMVPPLAALGVMVFWLVRVRVTGGRGMAVQR